MIYLVNGSIYRPDCICDNSMFLLGSVNTDHTSLLQFRQMEGSGNMDLPRLLKNKSGKVLFDLKMIKYIAI